MADFSSFPEEYIELMRGLAGPRFGLLNDLYRDGCWKGLRYNTKKIRQDTAEKLDSLWKLEKVGWCPEGRAYKESSGIRPGLSPYYHAGVFYMQEPSAMSPVEALDIGNGDAVLDLCAAPGGKTTQACAKAKLVVANEPVEKRARILSSNIERLGFTNAVVTSAYPAELLKAVGPSFDRIIADVPCSGEGMFRRDETALREWTPSAVAGCIARQKEILESVYGLLKDGGRFVYSTCTFEPGENELQINDFLTLHPDCSLIDSRTFYPFEVHGEGQFYAVIGKSGARGDTAVKKDRFKESDPEHIGVFLKNKGIHVLRSGLEKGTVSAAKNGKMICIPSHAEAMAAGDLSHRCADIHNEELCIRYLKGESLNIPDCAPDDLRLDSSGGWLIVCFDGYPLGWGKLVGNVIKNHYPKGLRLL